MFERLADRVLDECHDTFTACFHAFYPTGNLKWTCLCELLMLIEPVSGDNDDNNNNLHRWFSGRMLACMAGGPVADRLEEIYCPERQSSNRNVTSTNKQAMSQRGWVGSKPECNDKIMLCPPPAVE